MDGKLSFFATDYAQASAAAGIDNFSLEPVGRYLTYPPFGGSAAFKLGFGYRVPNAEVTPARLFGGNEAELVNALTLANLDPILRAQASSFRVVHAVSERECKGILTISTPMTALGSWSAYSHCLVGLRTAIKKKLARLPSWGACRVFTSP